VLTLARRDGSLDEQGEADYFTSPVRQVSGSLMTRWTKTLIAIHIYLASPAGR